MCIRWVSTAVRNRHSSDSHLILVPIGRIDPGTQFYWPAKKQTEVLCNFLSLRVKRTTLVSGFRSSNYIPMQTRPKLIKLIEYWAGVLLITANWSGSHHSLGVDIESIRSAVSNLEWLKLEYLYFFPCWTFAIQFIFLNRFDRYIGIDGAFPRSKCQDLI